MHPFIPRVCRQLGFGMPVETDDGNLTPGTHTITMTPPRMLLTSPASSRAQCASGHYLGVLREEHVASYALALSRSLLG